MDHLSVLLLTIRHKFVLWVVLTVTALVVFGVSVISCTVQVKVANVVLLTVPGAIIMTLNGVVLVCLVFIYNMAIPPILVSLVPQIV